MSTQQLRLGMGGHESPAMKGESWLTPRWILEALGEFDLDPCACPDPRPWPTAKEHYTRATGSGLLKPFFGRVWLNPPYGGAVGRWLARLAMHGEGTALIFARTETEQFHIYVWGKASAIVFLRGRLTFHRQTGEPALHNAGAPSCLVAYGEHDAQILRDTMRKEGHFVRITPQ